MKIISLTPFIQSLNNAELKMLTAMCCDEIDHRETHRKNEEYRIRFMAENEKAREIEMTEEEKVEAEKCKIHSIKMVLDRTHCGLLCCKMVVESYLKSLEK
jgi:hypothetical protein